MNETRKEIDSDMKLGMMLAPIGTIKITNLATAKDMFVELYEKQTRKDRMTSACSCIAIQSLITYIRVLEVELGVDEMDTTPTQQERAYEKLSKCQELRLKAMMDRQNEDEGSEDFSRMYPYL